MKRALLALFFVCGCGDSELPPLTDGASPGSKDHGTIDLGKSIDGRPADMKPAADRGVGRDGVSVDQDGPAADGPADASARDVGPADGFPDSLADSLADLGRDQTPTDAACQGDATMPCYPFGALGCTQDTSGAWNCRGTCRTGTRSCVAGQLSACVGAVTPQVESCDNQDNDCDGTADNLPARSCSNTCGRGMQTCSGGQWGACDATGTRACYSGTAGCTQGSAGGWTCLGECKTGTQSCANGTWSSCGGDITPQVEACDSKDNDCDGTVDNVAARSCSNACGSGTQACVAGSWGTCNATASRDCYPSATAGCSQGSGGAWSCEGECKTGRQSCADGTWSSCSGQVTPQAETCDNKDNNCDGKVDDLAARSCTNTCGSGMQSCSAGRWSTCDATSSRDCYPANTAGCTQGSAGGWSCQGECKTGRQSCANGAWSSCSGQTIPVAELCDALDNDCDATADETCGRPITFAVVNANGTRAASRNITSSSLGATAPVYTITAGAGIGCDTHTMLVTPRTNVRRPASVTCSGTNYVVRIGNASGSTFEQAPFSLVIPPSNPGEVWGRGYIYKVNFGSGTVTYLVPDVVYGNPTMTRVSTGIYDVDSTACSSANQPVFVAINSDSLDGFAVGYYLSSGKCQVRTYDLSGNVADRGFVFWIPDAAQYPWALTSTNGLSASNNFGDQYVMWDAAPITDSTGAFSYFRLTYPGIDTATAAILVNPRTADRMATPIAISGGAAVSRTIANATPVASPIAIGFFR